MKRCISYFFVKVKISRERIFRGRFRFYKDALAYASTFIGKSEPIEFYIVAV